MLGVLSLGLFGLAAAALLSSTDGSIKVSAGVMGIVLGTGLAAMIVYFVSNPIASAPRSGSASGAYADEHDPGTGGESLPGTTRASFGRPPAGVSRYINSACYVFSGGAILVLESLNHKGAGVPITIVAIAMLLYGLYVGFTRASYWVSSATYIIPVLAIMWGYVSLKR